MLKDIVGGNGGVVGAAARYGIGIVLSLVLTAFVITKVDAALVQIQAGVDANAQRLAEAKVVMTAYTEEDRRFKQEMLKVWRQTCINTSKTDQQRQGCF